MDLKSTSATPAPLEDWDAESFTPAELTTISKLVRTLPIKTRFVNPSELTGMTKAQKKAYLKKFRFC